MVGEFERRRNLVLERLRDMGIKCNQPQGAFYVFPSIENPEKLVLEALKKMLCWFLEIPLVSMGTDISGFLMLHHTKI